jgi:enoyl-[acyl-carrier protein] reductase II
LPLFITPKSSTQFNFSNKRYEKMENRVCELLGIKYPIIQGGMAGYSKPKLVSAVSNAGGLGLLAGATGPKALQEDIDKTRGLTDKPFGVNIPLALLGGKNQAVLEIALKKNIKIFVTAAGNPEEFAKTIKSTGGVLMHVVPSVRHAIKAEQAGVDIIITEGTEGGGLVGPLGITTFALVPQVANAVKVPIIAAGGIGDSRGFVAALALGAQGIQMGTRFLATAEADIDEDLKKVILAATDNSTELTGNSSIKVRLFNKEFIQSVLQNQQVLSITEELSSKELSELSEKMQHEEVKPKGMFAGGQVAGMISGS